MNSFHTALITLVLITAASGKETDRHIVAAYPIDFPVEEFAELVPQDNPPDDSRFFQKTDTIFDLNTKSEILKSLPESEVTYLCFNRDTQTIVAKASANYHFHLSSEVACPDFPNIHRLTCKIYQMTPGGALAFLQGKDPPSAFDPPVLLLTGVGRPGSILTMQGRSGSEDNAINATLTWDFVSSRSALTSDSLIDLAITSSANSSSTRLKTQFGTTPISPITMALGRTRNMRESTLVITFSIQPIHPNGDILINGRICENPADHEVFLRTSEFDNPTAHAPEGVFIKHYRVPPDFISYSYKSDPQIADPFAAPANPKEHLAGENHTKLSPKQTPGLEHSWRTYYDAKPYLISRGVPVTKDDWIAFDQQRGILYARLENPESHELLEVLTSSTGPSSPANVRHTYYVIAKARDENEPTSESLRAIYSVVSRPGSPWKLSTQFPGGTENQSDLHIEADPTVSMEYKYVDTTTSFTIPTSPARTSSFSAEKWSFTQIADHPLTIDTGLDDFQTRDVLLRINTSVKPVEKLLHEFRQRGE